MDGRRIAGFTACRDDVITMGAHYDFGWLAMIDGNIVTGRVPHDVPEFVDAITDALCGTRLLDATEADETACAAIRPVRNLLSPRAPGHVITPIFLVYPPELENPRDRDALSSLQRLHSCRTNLSKLINNNPPLES